MEKQILDTGDEAARYVTNIEGWVDQGGRFWGNDERMARWSGCTHVVCKDCGKPTPKNYIICLDCGEKKAIERYEKKERKQWQGKYPLYSEATGKYFFDNDELDDYLDDIDGSIESLRLVIYSPNYLRLVEADYLCDDMLEDGELPADVVEALENLNRVIRAQEPVSWFPGKYAAVV